MRNVAERHLNFNILSVSGGSVQTAKLIGCVTFTPGSLTTPADSERTTGWESGAADTGGGTGRTGTQRGRVLWLTTQILW